MSKMDGLRAMREARYAAAQAASGGTAKKAERPAVAPAATPAKATPAKATKAKRAPAKAATAPAAGADEVLCGHRNMGGKSCTREQGHSAKSHRYS